MMYMHMCMQVFGERIWWFIKDLAPSLQEDIHDVSTTMKYERGS